MSQLAALQQSMRAHMLSASESPTQWQKTQEEKLLFQLKNNCTHDKATQIKRKT